MARSSSSSEGEISEGVTHPPKVPKVQQPLTRTNRVDPVSRPTLTSLHPTSPSTSLADTTPPDRSDRSRSSSSQPEHTRKKMRIDRGGRHPDRRDHGRNRNDRRDGRRQEDTRRHVPHYEDPRSQRGRISYDDVDDRRDEAHQRPNGSFNRHDNFSQGRTRGRDNERPNPMRHRNDRSRSPYYRGRDRSRSPFRRSRSRSRSPYHAGKDRNRSRSPYHAGKDRNRSLNHEASNKFPPSNAQDLRNGNRGNLPNRNGFNAPQHSSNRSATQTMSLGANGVSSITNNSNHTQSHQRNVHFANDVKASNSASTTHPTKVVKQPEPEPEPEPEPVDENAEVEKRRLRREALKARLKSQQASSLSQEMQTSGESGPSSPAAERSATPMSRSVSPSVRTPVTPLHESGPGSPLELVLPNDDELANRAANGAMEVDTNGQSAADYDPIADMEADRLRQAQLANKFSSASFNELKQPPKEIPLPPADQVPPSNDKKAPATTEEDDDDYDMFDMDLDESRFEKVTSPAPQPSKAAIPSAPAMEAGPVDNFDDSQGYYRPRPKELLNNQYRVIEILGNGMFSNVCSVMDIHSGVKYAIKMIRKNETMLKAGLKEIEVLKRLKEEDPDDKRHMIRFEGHFEFRGHLCIMFECLSVNLRELIKKYGRLHGLNIKAVKPYGRQILQGLALLEKCGFIHADLKPDNIIVTEDHTSLKICDLGTAIDVADIWELTGYMASRFYRAPEVMLGFKPSYAFDMWSFACTLFELYTAKILFTGGSNNQMLKLIMECRGNISMKLLKKGEFAGKYFEDDGRFKSEEINPATNQVFMRHITFTKPLPGRDLRSRVYAAAQNVQGADAKELDQFIDLLDKCLHLNPEKRLTPREALHHPFFTHDSRVVNIKSSLKIAK